MDDSLYPKALANLVVTGALLSEIKRGHAVVQLFFHILYSHQKFTKDDLYHDYIAHWMNFGKTAKTASFYV